MASKVATVKTDLVLQGVEGSLAIAVLLIAFAVVGAHQVALVGPDAAVLAVTRQLRLVRLLEISASLGHLAELAALEGAAFALDLVVDVHVVLGVWHRG